MQIRGEGKRKRRNRANFNGKIYNNCRYVSLFSVRHNEERQYTTRGGPAEASGSSLPSLSAIVPAQGLLVSSSKTVYNGIYRAMVAEVAPRGGDDDGAFERSEAGVRIGGKNTIGGMGAMERMNRFQDAVRAMRQGKGERGGPQLVLYVGNACPWCHRVLIALTLLSRCADAPLSTSVRVVQLDDDPERARKGGWVVAGTRGDPVFGERDLYGVYTRGFAPSAIQGKCTAPLLAYHNPRRSDAVGVLLSNESDEIVRLLDEAARACVVDSDGGGLMDAGGIALDLRPPDGTSSERGMLKTMIYDKIANAVYRSGFSTTQNAYDEANADLRAGLDAVEDRLATGGPFLCGDTITDCDLLLFPTIVRFDKAYKTLFRAGGGSIRILGGRCSDYPAIKHWAERLWFSGRSGGDTDDKGLRNTIDIAAAVVSYHRSLFMLCPSGIVTGGVQSRAQAEADLGLDVPSNECEAWLRLASPSTPAGGGV